MHFSSFSATADLMLRVLVNGIRLQGQIRWFDNFTVLLVRGNGTQVVYKHAISTIHPAEPVQLSDPPSIGEISPPSP